MEGAGLTAATRWAMAVGCAVTVGNLYYIQPLLVTIAHDLHVSDGQAGVLATLSQLGFAVGMLVLVPLGDFVERRGLVILTIAASSVLLLAISAIHAYPVMAVASFALGFATVTPQLLVPFAAALAPAESRGRVVGFVMSGLLIGILLARTVSGWTGHQFGWRAMYVAAAVASVALAAVMRATLPVSRPTAARIGPIALARSLAELIRSEPILRESAVFGACTFAAFSAFWTTLAFLLAQPPLRMGADVVGLFGLVGLAGAVAAPVAGRLADRGGPRRTIAVALVLVAVSFGVYLLGSIPALVIGVILMDIGCQAAHISNQSRIYSVRPESRNRMNTVYMTSMFGGGAAGSALAAMAWSAAGWPGVCAVGAGAALVAIGTYLRTARRYSTDVPT